MTEQKERTICWNNDWDEEGGNIFCQEKSQENPCERNCLSFGSWRQNDPNWEKKGNRGEDKKLKSNETKETQARKRRRREEKINGMKAKLFPHVFRFGDKKKKEAVHVMWGKDWRGDEGWWWCPRHLLFLFSFPSICRILLHTVCSWGWKWRLSSLLSLDISLLKSWWWPHLCKVKLRGCFCRSVAFPFPLETEKVWILPNISNFFFSTKHVPCYNFCYFLSEGNEKGEQKKQVILLFLDIFVYIPLKSWNRRSRKKCSSDLHRKEEETIRFLFRSVQDEQECFTPAGLDPLSFPATNALDCMIYGGVIF